MYHMVQCTIGACNTSTKEKGDEHYELNLDGYLIKFK